jgi:hypothetical protein
LPIPFFITFRFHFRGWQVALISVTFIFGRLCPSDFSVNDAIWFCYFGAFVPFLPSICSIENIQIHHNPLPDVK